jgi:serine-type D-Ala-D-Ala carboxypeptidase (penicillin-binding protein 5/6)
MLRRQKILRACTVCGVALVLSVHAFGKAPARSKPFASAICVVADTGLVLYEYNAGKVRAPASMIKMMQMLLVSEGIKKGSWTLETPVKVTLHAQKMGGSQVYVEAGEVVPLGLLMKAVAVASANDGAMAVAEGLWGSEKAYLKAVNRRARELGMANSEFHSVHGLPPDAGQKPDRTTALDMSILARKCVQVPQIMAWTKEKEFRFRPKQAVKYNTNKLLWRMDDCDGLKTGFTNAAGFCLTATAKRDGIRLITVLMGCTNKTERFRSAQSILELAFKGIERVQLVAKGQVIEPGIPVQNCEKQTIRLAAVEDVWVILKTVDKGRICLSPQTPRRLAAPIQARTVLGEVQVQLGGAVIGRSALAATDNLAPARLRWKLLRSAVGRVRKRSVKSAE